jgi:hypothetical protein
VEDIHGASFTQSQGLPDSYRWLAPELGLNPTTMATASDIYAFSMTIIEVWNFSSAWPFDDSFLVQLLTHKEPFSYIKSGVEVMVKASQGARPVRPTDASIINRGLDDKLWKLLTNCWMRVQNKRPNIREVLAELSWALAVWGKTYVP